MRFFGLSAFSPRGVIEKIQKLPKILKFPLKLVSLMGDRYSKLNYFINSDDLSFYLGIRGLFSPQETAKILDINLSEVKNFIDEFSCGQATGKLHPVDLLSYLELKFYLQNQLLKDTDFMSMYHSIEVRVPFLDHKLAEYVSNLPPEIKLGNKINKPLLVESVRDLLPEEIFTRSKMGFTFPFQKWMRKIDSDFSGGHWSRFWAKKVLNKF